MNQVLDVDAGAMTAVSSPWSRPTCTGNCGRAAVRRSVQPYPLHDRRHDGNNACGSRPPVRPHVDNVLALDVLTAAGRSRG